MAIPYDGSRHGAAQRAAKILSGQQHLPPTTVVSITRDQRQNGTDWSSPLYGARLITGRRRAMTSRVAVEST